jgi:hypothetical protein
MRVASLLIALAFLAVPLQADEPVSVVDRTPIVIRLHLKETSTSPSGKTSVRSIARPTLATLADRPANFIAGSQVVVAGKDHPIPYGVEVRIIPGVLQGGSTPPRPMSSNGATSGQR